MALVIDLKAGEKLIIGEAVITNAGERARLHIAGKVPILREKDILRPEEADTPCKNLYLTVQLLYLGPASERLHKTYVDLARDIRAAAPSTTPFILAINENIIQGAYFRALKEAKRLVDHEAGLIADAKPL